MLIQQGIIDAAGLSDALARQSGRHPVASELYALGYASERQLTVENARCVEACLAADAARAVGTIVAISDAGRAPKNDPAIFALAARRFGHAPGAMLLVDDNADNVASARACGWQAHHFADAEKLAADLRRRGLLP